MKEIIKLNQFLLLAIKPFLKYFTKCKYPKETDSAKNFHIIGVDVLIDEEGKCWLMEINANPSLNIEFDTSEKRSLGDKLSKSKSEMNPISEVDLHVKSK